MSFPPIWHRQSMLSSLVELTIFAERFLQSQPEDFAKRLLDLLDLLEMASMGSWKTC